MVFEVKFGARTPTVTSSSPPFNGSHHRLELKAGGDCSWGTESWSRLCARARRAQNRRCVRASAERHRRSTMKKGFLTSAPTTGCAFVPPPSPAPRRRVRVKTGQRAACCVLLVAFLLAWRAQGALQVRASSVVCTACCGRRAESRCPWCAWFHRQSKRAGGCTRRQDRARCLQR